MSWLWEGEDGDEGSWSTLKMSGTAEVKVEDEARVMTTNAAASRTEDR